MARMLCTSLALFGLMLGWSGMSRAEDDRTVIQVHSGEGSWMVVLDDGFRKIEIAENAQGITMTVIEMKNGNEVKKEYRAKDAAELEKKHPEAYKIYQDLKQRMVEDSKRMKEEAKRMAEEARRMAAESQRMVAESQRMAVEAKRMMAESCQRMVEDSRRMAEEAKRVAEGSKPERWLVVSGNGFRKVEIVENAQGITMTVIEMKNGNEVKKEYRAKDAAELEKKHPEAYKIYQEYIECQRHMKKLNRKMDEFQRRMEKFYRKINREMEEFHRKMNREMEEFQRRQER